MRFILNHGRISPVSHHSHPFWRAFAISLLILAPLFAWELGLIPHLPSLPRSPTTLREKAFVGVLLLMLCIDIGLFAMHKNAGHCRRRRFKSKMLTTVAGTLGALTVLCPACLLLPASLFSIGFFFTILTPYLPILRGLALVLLVIAAVILWPKERK